MNKISKVEIQKAELNLLQEFHEFCQSNGLKYSLCGGTLLGAVRHKGFIPWDDDVDVLMLQEDFDKFINIASSQNTAFGLIYHGNTPTYFDFVAKIYDKNTLIEDELMDYQNMGLGLHIDVCPIKLLGSSYNDAIKIYNSLKIWRELLITKNWNHYTKSKTRKWYYEPARFLLYLIGKLFDGNKLMVKMENEYKKLDTSNSLFAGCVYGSYREKEIMNIEAFREYLLMPFENKEFFCIKNYDIYLSNLYGDYMKLPPEEKRKSHHYFTAYLK